MLQFGEGVMSVEIERKWPGLAYLFGVGEPNNDVSGSMARITRPSLRREVPRRVVLERKSGSSLRR
jgi:hypothetical protein